MTVSWEHGREGGRVLAPEARRRAIVRLPVASEVDERCLLPSQPGELARGAHAVQVAPGQHAEQRVGMVRLLALRTGRHDEVGEADAADQIYEHVHRVVGR
jgi:hypothetical protein